MRTVTFKTRLAAGGEQFTTVAIVDFTECTQEQIEELALRSVVIATQAIYRTIESVPMEDQIVVADLLKREKGGFKATPESLAKKIKTFTPEDRAALLALLAS